MTSRELLDVLRKMAPAERKELATAVIADPDGFSTFKHELDRYMQRGLKSHDEKLIQAGKLGDRADLERRLDRIEDGYRKKLRAKELELYVKLKATVLGIDPVLLEGSYSDETEIDARADLVSATMKRLREEDLSERMKDSYKPQTGNGQLSSTAKGTLERYIALESANELNDLIETKR